jgi:DNA-binding response OmpR family regulator
MMKSQRKKIVVVSRDAKLAQLRKTVLETAGFEVLPAKDPETVRKACIEQKPHLVMVGYSVLPAQKRRVWVEVREHCKTPVLELHKGEKPTLISPAYFHQAVSPDDFLIRVQELVAAEL